MRVALQLYTIRDKIKEDYLNSLKNVAEIGYKYIEFAGHPFLTVELDKLKKFLNDIGITPVSAHVSFEMMDTDPDKILTYASRLGLKYVVSEPNVRKMKNFDDCVKAAVKMNKMGKKAYEYGIRFGMHNHAIEFDMKFREKTVYDILIENTDPEFVFFQPDVYWIKYAGYDPVEVLSRLKDRCYLVHLKDMKDLETKDMIELGQGILDFKAIVNVGEKVGVDYYIVENDRPSMDSLESVRVALNYLKENFEVE
ncbi:MAG: sugar phosphate isomerase/epimerase [Thermoproteales archaeon]|nr:sugar phosphate isomerase/epimerase [Thermoproteales archaeon]